MDANILRFLRWIFLKVCTVQEKGYTFPILYTSLYLSIEFLENKELKGSEKRGKIQKSPIFLTRYCHGNDLQKINNNTDIRLRECY